jgi:hypothetical protein
MPLYPDSEARKKRNQPNGCTRNDGKSLPQTSTEASGMVTFTLSFWGRDMSNATETNASPGLRVMFAVAAAIMLSLWGWSLVPPIENWGNPRDDGFSYVPLFYTTIICLPVGLYLLLGAIAGHGPYVRRARNAFFIASGITLLVVAFLIVQHIANNNDGKVFGIQIGFRLDRQDARETGELPAKVTSDIFDRGRRSPSLPQ